MPSNLSAFPYFQEREEATPSAFNTKLSIISANIASLDSTLDLGHFQQLSIGSTPPSYATTAAVTIEVNSAYSDYLYLVDSSGQKSSYIIGSRAGGLADGLNIWDASAGTMIASFSKQSIRFFQNVVGPVFDLGGALSATYNAATFGTGADSVESRIQSAINQASIDHFKYVYLPASMVSYSASSVSFIYSIRMVREGGEWDVADVQAYGARGNGSRDDTVAIQQALYSCAPGETAYASPTTQGYVVGESSLSVPTAVRLRGGNAPSQAGRWVEPVGLGSASVPGGTMFKISNVTNRIVKLGGNSAVQGITFWYPNQTWSMTTISQSFITYAATIQLGLATGSVAGVFNMGVFDCHFLGASVGIEQLETNGNPVNDLHIDNCTGTILGPFLRVYSCSDPIRLTNIVMSPAFAASYVQDGAVGGNAIIFRTKMAQQAKVCEFGRVPDVDAVNVFGYGQRYFVDYQRNFYAGDDNQEAGGRWVNCIADTCQAMFRVQRSSNIAPLSLTNCWAVPTFRPTGTSADSAEQALILFSNSSVSDYRVALHAVRVYGTANTSNFSTGYTGVANYAIRANQALGVNVNIIGNGLYFHNVTGIADSFTSGAVALGVHALADVLQDFNHPQDIVSGLPTTSTGRNIVIRAAPANVRDLQWKSGVSLRWALRANAVAEAGANVGSNLEVIAFDDTGAVIDLPIQLSRATGGAMTVGRPTSFERFQTFKEFSLFADGTVASPALIFTNEGNLGLYRSGRSRVGLSYGQFSVPDGSATTPSLGYSSNSSLGFYTSGAQTVAQSLGTFNLATNAVRFSMRTLAASSVTASAAKTNVATNEVVFTIGGASGASLIISSGGTAYIFNSAASAILA